MAGRLTSRGCSVALGSLSGGESTTMLSTHTQLSAQRATNLLNAL